MFKKIIYSLFPCLFVLMNIGFVNINKDVDINTALLKYGQYLFYSNNISYNRTKSCATCHAPELAFTDGYRRSQGIYADEVRHNTPSLLNLNTYATLNRANPQLLNIRDQIMLPLFKQNPPELGALHSDDYFQNRFKEDKLAITLASSAFPDDSNPLVWKNALDAIAYFVASLQSRNSAYDDYLKGDENALTLDEKEGMTLFKSEEVGCMTCHGGQDFNQSSKDSNSNFYKTSYITDNLGCYETTKNDKDKHKFRTPSLRNVAITAPYFHDGKVTSLKDCLHDAHRELDTLEKTYIIKFLYTLTDTSYLSNPNFNYFSSN
ncbi:MAG: hypothetical protein KBA06_01930 [Saprospiraceae bacterium]|nr:hypothetical protein [Saprospiraceae bacterium]